jgi:hypothetical protein
VGKVGRKSTKSPPGSLPPRDNCLAPAVDHAASIAVRGGDQCFDNLFIAIERIEELARDLGTNAVDSHAETLANLAMSDRLIRAKAARLPGTKREF